MVPCAAPSVKARADFTFGHARLTRAALATNIHARRHSMERASIQTEEPDASAQVLAEQSRQTEINQRLDELERALAR